MNNLGIIAGSGDFPLLVAKGARRMGTKQIVVAALIGETKKDIEMLVDIVVWIELDQLKEIVHCFKKNGCTSVAFAGQITPTKLFSSITSFLKNGAKLYSEIEIYVLCVKTNPERLILNSIS